MKDNYIHVIQNKGLFKNIDQQNIENAIHLIHGFTKSYRKDEYLLHIGDPVKYAGIVLEGAVEGSFISETYNKINMNHFETGRIFAEAMALISVQHSPIQLTALSDCTILWLDIKVLSNNGKDVLPYQSQLSVNLMRLLASKNVFTNLKLRIANQKSLRTRVFIYLYSLTPDADGYVHVPFTKTALAEFLGVNRSALSREFGRMIDEGLIEETDRGIKILVSHD